MASTVWYCEQAANDVMEGTPGKDASSFVYKQHASYTICN